MANQITGWQGGRLNSGLTWTAAFASTDLPSLPSGSTILSSAGAITNGTSLDMFIDISVRCIIAASTIPAGAALPLWLFPLLDDGSTYGDGQFTAGTQAAKTPTFAAIGSIPLVVAALQTSLVGALTGITIPPGSFLPALQNLSTFTFTSGTQTVKYRSYNINLTTAT